jgi:hypothetical protein
MEANVIMPTSEHVKMDRMEMVILPQGSWMKIGANWQAAPGVMGVKTSSHITFCSGDKGLPIALIVDGTATGVHSVSTLRITYDPSITIAPPK